jgi:hypothetical protein
MKAIFAKNAVNGAFGLHCNLAIFIPTEIYSAVEDRLQVINDTYSALRGRKKSKVTVPRNGSPIYICPI